MGGFLDGNNTFTINTVSDTIPFIRVFEPMESVTIRNAGTSLLVNPRLIINNRGNWYSVEDVMQECIPDSANEKEKFMYFWDFFRKNTFHNPPAEVTGHEPEDPVKFLSVYGYGWCGQSTQAIFNLARSKGHDAKYGRWTGTYSAK